MNDINEKIAENVDVCLLLDFYGQLLTEKTREILELHYAEDMSLAEISIQYDISRQAVFDTLRRGVAAIQEYEGKLNLAQRFKKQRDCIQDVISDMDKGDIRTAKNKLTGLIELL